VRRIGILLAGVCLAMSGCQGNASSPPPAASTASQSAPAPPQPSRIPTAAAKAPDALASQNTNWVDVVADVTTLRRKGNTLTAMLRLRKNSQGTAVVSFDLNSVYLLDALRGRKYLVLKDENGGFIASQTGYQSLLPEGPLTLWMKFPTPPPDVTTLTLVVPEMPPFEDLPIEGQ
jgi:hypothetical protein